MPRRNERTSAHATAAAPPAATREHTDDEAIRAVRRFSRFYTRKIGLLEDGLLDSPYSLTEARVIYELAQVDCMAAGELSQQLELDAGYVSRVVRALQRRRLVERRRSESDRRRSMLSLSARGQAAFGQLDAASRDSVWSLLAPVSPADRARLTHAMRTIEELLDPGPEPRVPYMLRPPRSGDFGWIVQRHGVLYRQEYGWDETFEALVAEIVAHFVEHFDPKRERCWVVERDGENVGSVCVVAHPERPGVAKLRLLLVEPRARGLGIGRRLVNEVTRFAREAGYEKITLWTNSVLHAARRLYEEEGYRLVETQPHHIFGHDLVSETWELDL